MAGTGRKIDLKAKIFLNNKKGVKLQNDYFNFLLIILITITPLSYK
jgi:hypothetical protein